MTDDLASLVDRASAIRVVVIGAGIAGLVAAWELAKVGMHVTVLEAADRVGGALDAADIAGVMLDLGAESFAIRGGHVEQLLADLGAELEITEPAGGGAWVVGVPGVGAAPLPVGGVLGIPANPFAVDVRRVIGWRGAWRAYVDRLRPPLTIGRERSLGRLVRSRMGQRVLERLVAPVTMGVYSAHPDDVDPDLAAPGLNAALTRRGSLSGAVGDLTAARRTAPGGAVRGIVGGMWQLRDVLANRIAELGGVIRTGAPVTAVRCQSHGERAWSVETADGETFQADAVVAACDDAAASALLGLGGEDSAHADETQVTVAPAVIRIVTLVIDDDRLDAAPRGSGVLAVPGSHHAKALTHVTAKWPWVGRAVPAGRHVVRVSFGSQGHEAESSNVHDLARAEAGRMLGVSIDAGAVVASVTSEYRTAQPASVLGQRARAERIRDALRTRPSIAVVGAWMAGTGLAQVVPDARLEADRLRQWLLFDSGEADGARTEGGHGA